MADRIVHVPDNRAVATWSQGDPMAGRLVLLCHPAPGSASFDPDPELTGRWGVQIVGIDRPGFGDSAPLPVDAVSDLGQRADDLAAYQQATELDARSAGGDPGSTVGVIGWGAGGRVALALAARYPNLVDRVAVIGTPAPGRPPVGATPALLAAAQQARDQPIAEARATLTAAFSAAVPDPASPDLAVLGVSDADSAALDRPGARDRLQRMLDEGLRQGVGATVEDQLAARDDSWADGLGRVSAEVLLVYGAKDPVVSARHGRRYRRLLKHARLHVEPGAGHLAIVPGWRRVLEHVAPGGAPGQTAER